MLLKPSILLAAHRIMAARAVYLKKSRILKNKYYGLLKTLQEKVN